MQDRKLPAIIFQGKCRVKTGANLTRFRYEIRVFPLPSNGRGRLSPTASEVYLFSTGRQRRQIQSHESRFAKIRASGRQMRSHESRSVKIRQRDRSDACSLSTAVGDSLPRLFRGANAESRIPLRKDSRQRCLTKIICFALIVASCNYISIFVPEISKTYNTWLLRHIP